MSPRVCTSFSWPRASRALQKCLQKNHTLRCLDLGMNRIDHGPLKAIKDELNNRLKSDAINKHAR